MVRFAMAMVMVVFLVPAPAATVAQAQLRPDFYSQSCPQLDQLVRPLMDNAIKQSPRNGAFILRMIFHDCFVQGCDASILLDDSTNPPIVSEKNAFANKDSLFGYDVIDTLKDAVEKVCPGVVSCADLITLAARDSVNILGGPSWEVPLGKRDSTTADMVLANGNLPSPNVPLDQLLQKFQSQGFTAEEVVALSGGHTIGMSQCRFFKHHIYNDTDIDQGYAEMCRQKCDFSDFDNRTADLDESTTVFDNVYFSDIMRRRVLLHTDQDLYSGNNGTLDWLVTAYASDKQRFFNDFAAAMVKLGSLNPLTGNQGEIRKNCRKLNNPAQ